MFLINEKMLCYFTIFTEYHFFPKAVQGPFASICVLPPSRASQFFKAIFCYFISLFLAVAQ